MIYVINGAPCSGKDTFCQYVRDILGERCVTLSTVDFIKKIAENCGWNGEKTPAARKMLSDLKDVLTEWDDVPYKKTSETIMEIEKLWKRANFHLSRTALFVMSREPQEIFRFVKDFDAKTIIIRRATSQEFSNHADANVENYNYDIEIDNYGTLEELKERAEEFVKNELCYFGF